MERCGARQADATALDFEELDAKMGPFTIAVSFLTSGARQQHVIVTNCQLPD